MMRNLIRGATLALIIAVVHPDWVCHGEANQEPAVAHADGTDESGIPPE